MELLLLACIVYVSFQAGKHYGYYKIVKLMKEVADEQGIDLEKELGLYKDREETDKTPTVHKLQVETHGELLYLFDTDSENFICQGSSVQELAEIAKTRKNVPYAVVKYGDKVFAFKDGVSTEVTTA